MKKINVTIVILCALLLLGGCSLPFEKSTIKETNTGANSVKIPQYAVYKDDNDKLCKIELHNAKYEKWIPVEIRESSDTEVSEWYLDRNCTEPAKITKSFPKSLYKKGADGKLSEYKYLYTDSIHIEFGGDYKLVKREHYENYKLVGYECELNVLNGIYVWFEYI